MKNFQKGFSLTELMLAMTIGLVLIGGLLSIIVSSSQSAMLVNAERIINKNGRFVLTDIIAQARDTGFAGCYKNLSLGTTSLLVNPGTLVWDITNTITGFNNVASTDDIGGVTGFIEDTDVLVLKHMEDIIDVTGTASATTLPVATQDNTFQQGDILIATNCDNSVIFQATGISIQTSELTNIDHSDSAGMTPGNTANDLGYTFDETAEIGRLVTTMYYIKNDNNGISSLYISTLKVDDNETVTTEELLLAQNIDSMQIKYGEDTDGDKSVDGFKNAGTVTNWNNILSIEIALLVSSESNFMSDNSSYTFDENSFEFVESNNTGNRKLKRIFSSYATLRSRVL